MSSTVRNALLFTVVVVIVFAIYDLESQKVSVPTTSAATNAAIDLQALSTGSSTAPLPHTPDFDQLSAQYPVARELVSPTGYINTPPDSSGQAGPITIKSLIGHKVILLDFWTYSCINCQRVIPYLNAWYAKYKDLGLEIIGVHTPEFQFEKNIDNVQAAVAKFGIQYPVVLDSNDETWSTYGNQYWPEEYLIDINGLVVDRNIGEGSYDATEHAIQKLLTERAQAMGLKVTIPSDLVDVSKVAIQANSPETYFGAERNEYLANGRKSIQGLQMLADPVLASIEPSQLYLGGSWKFMGQYATNQSADAHIFYKYNAQHVYFVAAAMQDVSITILRDGVPLTIDRGADVDAKGNATINQSRLYDLINEPTAGSHTLEIIVHDPGLQAYTFTFG